MRNRRARLHQLILFTLADLSGVLLGFGVAYLLRFHANLVVVTKSYSPENYLRLLPFAAVIWIFWLETLGCYEFRGRAFNLQILKKIVHANVLSVMTVIVLHFFERTQEYSRLLYPTTLVTCSVSIGAMRFLLDRTLARMRHQGRLEGAKVLILGTGQLGATIAERISHHAFLGLRVVGFVSDQPGDNSSPLPGLPVLGDFANIREIIRDNGIEEVIVAQPGLSPKEILDFMLECEKEIVSIRVVPNLLEAMLVEVGVEQIDGIPLFGLRDSPLQGWNIIVKRAFDILVSLTVLVVLSPLLLLAAACVKLSSPGPVFYRQKRIGLDGSQFNILKFRSMRLNAEEATGPVWATPNDERVTGFGRLMRRWNIDELPQLVNVLRGNMSLVGPRPERPHFVKQFREMVPRYMGRHRVKSGMTGWAQVNGLRGNTSIEERIKFDLYYIENWSIWLDLKILLMTLLPRALRNAY